MMEDLLIRVKKNNFTICVIGIGRVGLPLGLSFAKAGISVYGLDKSEDYVKELKKRKIPFYEKNIEKYIYTNNFYPTTNTKVIQKCDILIITVGTPLSDVGEPDYSQLETCLKDIVKYNVEDKLIIMRSTASPGTLENFIKPFLEKHTGLKANIDFGLVVCPERILAGKALEEIKELPEIIGAENDICAEITKEIFKKINKNKKFFVTTPKAAELGKLFINVYRYVNFALANEFGLLSEQYEEDAYEIINMINKDYKRGGIPNPGLTGGPCLSKDGYYLISNITFPDFILMAWRLNETIPQYIINKLKNKLKQKGKSLYNCKIAVLGIAFKADIDDTRYSPSIKIINILKKENAEVLIHDPYVRDTLPLENVINKADAIILATNHSKFKNILDKICKIGTYKKDCIIVDYWGFFNEKEVIKKGFDYIKFGSNKL